MNKRNKIIISLTGIVVVLLALLGLTYAYYLTRIEGNTNTNSISVTTADLSLTYGDGTGELSAENVMPGNEISSKTFTVKNEGQDIEAYTVALINIVNNFKFKDDLEVSISCNSNINNGKCDGFAEDYEDNIYKEKYPTVNSELFSLGIKKDEIHTYTLTVDYLYQEYDQSDDMGKILKGKVQIFDPKDTIEVSGIIKGTTSGDFVEIHSDIQTSEIIDGTYKFIGIPVDTHTLYLKNKKTSNEKNIDLTIKKGNIESIKSNQITITENSKVANVTIDARNENLSTTINKLHNGSLKNTILADDRITKNTGSPNFSKIADYKVTGDKSSGEIGMYQAEDDYGVSWYFRGQQSYNYVNFAGYMWRVVRINGDESVRLILDNILKKDIWSEYVPTSYNFHTDNAYVGYMFGLEGIEITEPQDRCLMLVNNIVTNLINEYPTKSVCESNGGKWTTTSYEAAHANVRNSIIKSELDRFYEKELYKYNGYISDTIFCSDKNLSSSSLEKGYGKISTLYAADDRIFSNATNPSLECSKGTENNASIFTVEQYTTVKNVITNGDLTYPIGLINGDELAMAGAIKHIDNKNVYLHNENITDVWWFSMTPKYGGGLSGTIGIVNGALTNKDNSWGGARPVINIKSNILVNSGNGTKENPYTLKITN